MDALVALAAGWGLSSIFLLDGDSDGTDAKALYRDDYLIEGQRLITLDELAPGIVKIEHVLDDQARKAIANFLGLTGVVSKKQVQRYFQERLAADEVVPLGEHFEARCRAILDGLRSRLASN